MTGGSLNFGANYILPIGVNRRFIKLWSKLYIAHRRESDGETQSLKEHLRGVG